MTVFWQRFCGQHAAVFMIEDPPSKLEGMFCLTAVLRSDRKERCHFMIACSPLLRTGMQTQITALRASLLCGYQPLNKAICSAQLVA
jgi:hypothetical protein